MQSPEQLVVFTPRAAPKTPAGLYLHAFKFHQHAHPYTRSSSTSTHAQPYTHLHERHGSVALTTHIWHAATLDKQQHWLQGTDRTINHDALAPLASTHHAAQGAPPVPVVL